VRPGWGVGDPGLGGARAGLGAPPHGDPEIEEALAKGKEPGVSTGTPTDPRPPSPLPGLQGLPVLALLPAVAEPRAAGSSRLGCRPLH